MKTAKSNLEIPMGHPANIPRYMGLTNAKAQEYYNGMKDFLAYYAPNYEQNTTRKTDCKTLVQLATDHPEKLDAINEFLKNIIVLVDMTGKAEQKKEHGFTVTTKKIRLLRNMGYHYYVTISDGKREARFTSNGNNVLTLADFASGKNANGIDFYGCSLEPGHIHKLGQWEKGQRRNIELCDMQNFINECLNVPIKYADEGEMVYTY